MTEAAYWWVNTVDVEPQTGAGAYGETYDTKRTGVPCWLEDEIKLVRDASGSEVTSSAWIAMAVADAADFPPGSRVTTPDRVAYVITNSALNSGSLDIGLDHAVITLT